MMKKILIIYVKRLLRLVDIVPFAQCFCVSLKGKKKNVNPIEPYENADKTPLESRPRVYRQENNSCCIQTMRKLYPPYKASHP